jgi:hypothetical protein
MNINITIININITIININIISSLSLLSSLSLVLKRKEKDLQSLREYNEIERQAFNEQANELQQIKNDKENMENKIKDLLQLQDNINERKRYPYHHNHHYSSSSSSSLLIIIIIRIQIESLQYKSGYELLKDLMIQNLQIPNDKKLKEEAERIVAIVDM